MDLRQKAPHAIEKPVDLVRRAQHDPAKNEPQARLRVRFTVRQSECCTPGPAEYQPLLDTEHLAQRFNIVDEMLGGVVLEFGKGRRAKRAALIEEHNAIDVRIPEAALGGVCTFSGAAVKVHGRDSVRVAAFLPIELVKAIDLEPSAGARFGDGRER